MDNTTPDNSLARDAQAGILAHWAWFRLRRYMRVAFEWCVLGAAVGLLWAATSWRQP